MSEFEAACSNLAATVMSLGEDLNDEADLENAVSEITSTEDTYVKKARAALCALAEAVGGVTPAYPPPPTTPVPRQPETNKFMKISATAEPSSLPRDVTPSDFQLWLLKFETFSNASWIPGPPTSGEKLRQLRVYLGTAWQDVSEHINFETATFDEVVQYLTDEISITYPVVRRRIELFSIPDQMHTEGPWEFWRRVVTKCKNGAIGSREAGLSLTYDQFLITLFLKGLKESDREKIQSKYMNYEATYNEMEEVAKSLEQSAVSLKAKPGKSKGMVNAIANKNKKPACAKCKRQSHQTSECKSPQCTYCGNYFHSQDKCWVNPQSRGFKGEQYARNYWAKAGKKPPTAAVAATGGLLALPAPTPAPATTARGNSCSSHQEWSSCTEYANTQDQSS